MAIAETSRFYKLKLVWMRIRYGLVLFSMRNLLSRIGIDIEPYYWVKEGHIRYSYPSIKGNEKEFSIKKLDFLESKQVLSKSSGMGHHVKKLKENIENGQFCIGLFHKDNIAAYMFIDVNDFTYRGKVFKLKDNEAYLLNMYTFEEYRGRNLAPYLRSKCYDLLKEKGIVNIFSITSYFNNSSKKFKRKLNAQNLNLVLSITLFKSFQKHFLLKTYKH